MKKFNVRIEFIRLSGKYFSDSEVLAKNAKSAEKKALQSVGNRDYLSVSVTQVLK